MAKRKVEVDTDRIKANILDEIKEYIRFTPMLFTIDSLPFYPHEQNTSKAVRGAILSYALSRKEVNVEYLQVAKTVALKNEDYSCIQRFEGEITGYNKRLQEVKAKGALEETQKNEKLIADIKSELDELEKELEDKDSRDLITIKTWSVDDKSWSFWWKCREFDLQCDWKIVDVDTWTNGQCHFENMNREKKRVRGVLNGDFNCRLYARLTLQTTKRFESEIALLKTKVGATKMSLARAEENSKTNRTQNKDRNCRARSIHFQIQR